MTGKRAVTNEIGQYDLSPATVTGLVRETLALRMPYVVWFASDGTAAKGLVDTDGALRPNGVAFRDLAQCLVAAPPAEILASPG